MDPISYVIDRIEDLMGHSPHPAVVAVPIGAYTVSNICDGVASITGDKSYDDAARISMAVGLVGAVASAVTGFRDYSRIPQDRPGDAHGIATSHGIGNAVATSMMAASFILRVRDHAHDREASIASRALALGAGTLTLYTAWLGGKLIQELGEGVKQKVTHEEW